MTDLSRTFSDCITRHYTENVLDIMAKTDTTHHYSLVIHLLTLYEENMELGDAVLSDPETTLQLFDTGLIDVQKRAMETLDNDKQGDYSVKINIHARITGLQLAATGANRAVFPRNDEIGNFLEVVGTVVKVTMPKLLEYEREYRCSKCRNSQVAASDYNLKNALLPPKVCINSCSAATFTAVKATSGIFKDYQELKIQEDVGKLHIGTIPSSIWITVDHDLVDTCHPGDHITVCGTVMRRWTGLSAGSREEVEIVVKANNLEVTNHQKTARLVTDDFRTRCDNFWESYKNRPLEGRDLILASFCPEVYGLYLVKLAMCIVLCGGVPLYQDEGSSVRSESHLLLVGDPGTGKSHMLRFAAKTSTRSVLTTGVGSTSAGLTVCAVREGSDWQLEAGALVLADGGVCCIDELNSMKEQDRTSIHEAMEQQTISVAKAGMVTKLNTRCSILAATNAKTFYDPSASLSSNVSLASPLLSRFDLVLVLQDTRSKDWDRVLSDFILEFTDKTLDASDEIWSIEKLQSYFALAKTHLPIMTQEANLILSRYYQAQRGADSRSAARTTVRMLESLVRLSQGHARLMLRKNVTLLDAIVAVTLVECSMASSALVDAPNALHAAFPEDPNQQYRIQAQLILGKLGLTDLLNKELERLNQIDILLANESVGLKGGLMVDDPPDHANHLSQRLTDVLTRLKKKKDRNVCEAANLTGKRRRESEKNINRKLRRTSESEKVLDAIEECKETEPTPLVTVEPEKPGTSKQQGTSEPNKKNTGEKKSVQSTVDKLLMFKKSSTDSGSVEKPKKKATATKTLNDLTDINPAFSSTPLEKTSTHSDTSSTENFFANSKAIAESPVQSVLHTTECYENSDLQTKANLTESGTKNTKSPTNSGYDVKKLKNLAKLGKSLSQTLSQKSSQSASQFSLHDMSWNDINLEL